MSLNGSGSGAYPRAGLRVSAEQRAFMQSQVGRVENVLFETKARDGAFEGYTKNYTKVKVKGDGVKGGEIIRVRLVEAHDDYCVGEVLR